MRGQGYDMEFYNQWDSRGVHMNRYPGKWHILSRDLIKDEPAKQTLNV